MRRFIIGPPVPTGREFGDGSASGISRARRMMPAQTSRPRPSGPTCTCLPRQSTRAPTAASESPRVTEAVAPRARSTQVGHRQRVAEQVFVNPMALADALHVPKPQSWRPDVPLCARRWPAGTAVLAGCHERDALVKLDDSAGDLGRVHDHPGDACRRSVRRASIGPRRRMPLRRRSR
jgi:hypothetical protein